MSFPLCQDFKVKCRKAHVLGALPCDSDMSSLIYKERAGGKLKGGGGVKNDVHN